MAQCILLEQLRESTEIPRSEYCFSIPPYNLQASYESLCFLLVLVFWIVMPSGIVGTYKLCEETCCLYLQGWIALDTYMQVHIALQPRRPTLTSSLLWESYLSPRLFNCVISWCRSSVTCTCRWWGLEPQQGDALVSCDLKTVECHQPLPRCYSLWLSE
jgi:hypothetical protein